MIISSEKRKKIAMRLGFAQPFFVGSIWSQMKNPRGFYLKNEFLIFYDFLKFLKKQFKKWYKFSLES